MDDVERFQLNQQYQSRVPWVLLQPLLSSVNIADSNVGKLTMVIPPYIKLEHDSAARKAIVSVEDKEIRNQREMWGMQTLVRLMASSN